MTTAYASPKAQCYARLAGLSRFGYLGFLGFLGLLGFIPGYERLWSLSGLAGLFGFFGCTGFYAITRRIEIAHHRDVNFAEPSAAADRGGM